VVAEKGSGVTPFSAICTNQNQKLDSSQNYSAIGVTPDPFSTTTNKKTEKRWPATILYVSHLLKLMHYMCNVEKVII